MIQDVHSRGPTFREGESAYVGSQTCKFTSGISTLISTCKRQERPLNGTVKNWRCSLPEDFKDEAEDDIGPESNDVETTQVEGALVADVLDADLEAALSKDWDQLELFGSINQEEKNPRSSNEDVEDNSISEQDEDIDDTTADPAASDSKSASRLESSSTEEEPPIQFLETSASRESDDAVTAIKEAGKTKKRKPRASAKKKEPKKTLSRDEETGEVREMTQRELLNSEEWGPEPRWFFLQVKPGCEQSCAISLRNMAESLENLNVLEVLVPATTIMRLTKSGKSVKKEERLFPGYILILMVMNRQNYADVQRVPNVQWFMGDPNRDKKKDQPFRPPLPVTDAEMSFVFEKVREADSAKPEVKTALRPGNSIRVISGTHSGSTGRVVEVKPDTHLVKARLRLFGGESTAELEFGQVEVIADIDVEAPLPEDNVDGSEESKQLAKGDSNRKRFSAGVASAEDDLAFLLDSDEGDSPWDPLAPEAGESKDDGFSEGEIFDGDKQTSEGSIFNNTGKKSKKEYPPGKNELDSFLGDDLSEFLGNGDESDLWGSRAPARSAPSRQSRGETDQSKNSYDPEQDPFSFLDGDDSQDVPIFSEGKTP